VFDATQVTVMSEYLALVVTELFGDTMDAAPETVMVT